MVDNTLATPPKAKPDPLAYLRSLGIGGSPESAPDEAAIPSVITALSNEPAKTGMGKDMSSPPLASPPSGNTLSVRHQALPPEMSASLTPPNPDVEEADPTPPAIKAALPQMKSDPALTSLSKVPIPAPLKAKKTFGQRIIDALPYIGALGGAMEAAGNRGEAPGANRLLQTEQGLLASKTKKRELDIEQQKANTEAEYKKSLASQYGLQEFTIDGPDGQPMTIYAQPKDMGKIGSTQVTQAGRANVENIKQNGQYQIEQLKQGGGMLVDPEYAKLAGQPQLAGKYINGQTLKNYIAMLNSKGIHIGDLGEEGLWSVDKAGNKLKRVSVSSPSVARAKAYASARASNTPVNVVDFDDSGNPVGVHAISQTEQLATGAPSANVALAVGKATNKIYEPAVDADTRLKQMYQQATDKTGASDQALLFNHIAMTGGNVKGLRMGEHLTEAHRKARGIGEELGVMWNHLAMGESLSPQQRINFVRLAEQVRQSRWDQARRQAALLGVSDQEPAPDGDLPEVNTLSSVPVVRNTSARNVKSTPKASSSSSVQNLLKKYPPKR